MDDVKAKQQVVEKINAATNILVTVSNNPSVDALSAAIGLTLLLDKLEKHPTAVFSGSTPPAIAFLQPEKVLDENTDSLRDFIIALDKEKADHLRYKVDGDKVKIFITPYKKTIDSKDLEFSQGDFNVELVIALGVDNQDHLDGALESHGQILHDATIITATAGTQASTLGGIDWNDPQASSLSEMIAGLTEALKTDKVKSLLDPTIATSLLTGIVAETDRFSNTHTTSRVMTIAAQLMAGGADQQLIASKLQEGGSIEVKDANESLEPAQENKPATPKDTLDISHDPNETLEEMDKRVKASNQSQASEVATEALNDRTGEEPTVGSAYAPDATPEGELEPSLGGTLNATAEQAANDAREQAKDDKNKTILTHSYLSSAPAYEAPMNATSTPDSGVGLLGSHENTPETEPVEEMSPSTDEPMHSAYSVDDNAPLTPPTPPAPADLGLPMPPPVPDFSAGAPLAPPSSAYAPTAPQPERLGDILAPEPISPAQSSPASEPSASPVQPPLSGSTDPAQFKIPGQS